MNFPSFCRKICLKIYISLFFSSSSFLIVHTNDEIPTNLSGFFQIFQFIGTVDEKLYIHCVARNIFSFLIFPPSTYSANRGEERGRGGGWTA